MRKAILTLLLGACRFNTGGVSDGGVAVPEASLADMGSEPPAPEAGSCGPDAGVCCGEPEGSRVCETGADGSAECAGGEVVHDRDCPPGSKCVGFLCALDTSCQSCDPGGCGAGQMCSVFATVSPESTNFCCTPCFAAPRGCGTPGARCGNGDQCASGICIMDDGGIGDGGPPDGGAGQCYYHCQIDLDCGDGGVCQSRHLKVDGRGRDLDSCRKP